MIWLILLAALAALLVAAPALLVGALAEQICRPKRDRR